MPKSVNFWSVLTPPDEALPERPTSRVGPIRIAARGTTKIAKGTSSVSAKNDCAIVDPAPLSVEALS